MTPDRERLAAEHVIGLLEGEDRREAERLLASDASFRDAVARWQSRFSELDGTATALAPAEDLWQRIEAGLGPTVAARAPSSQRLVFADARAAFRSLWRSLAFWRIAGIAGAFASMLLAIGLAVVADQRAKQPVLVAVLFMDANRPGAVVNTFANGARRTRSPGSDRRSRRACAASLDPVGSHARPGVGRPHRFGAHDSSRSREPADADAEPAFRDHARARKRLADRPSDRPRSDEGQRRDRIVSAAARAARISPSLHKNVIVACASAHLSHG